MSNADLIKQIKTFFEEESIKNSDMVEQFSKDVIITAYQKLTANLTDMIQNEEDPMILSEMLKNFLEVTEAVENRNLPRQQLLLKLFEQLTKYEQSRYY